MNSTGLSDRQPKWDNLKCFLIFCVVTGHVIYRFLDSSVLARGIYLFLYTFHMPLFVFLSGMFSKKAMLMRQYGKVLFYILMYLIMKASQSFAESFGKGKMTFRFFWESGPGWYALAMAVYLAVGLLLETYIEGYDKRKWLVITLVIGVLWGYDGHMGDHFCSARILNFYPFFVLGSCMDPKTLGKPMKSRWAKAIALFVLAVVAGIALTRTDSCYWLIKVLKGKYPFEDIGLELWKGAVVRALYYPLTVVIGFAVATLAFERRTFLCYIGRHTLSVFLWHTSVIILLLDICGLNDLLCKAWPIHPVQGFVLFACMVTILCASRPFVKLTAVLSRLCTIQRGA